MLQPVAPELWHVQQRISVAGLVVDTRMTVVRLADRRLWLHSPIGLTDQLQLALAELGRVAFVVAPSKTHNSFIGDYLRSYPEASFFAAPGLPKRKPQLASLRVLTDAPEAEWAAELDQVVFQGIPALNEVVWFHRPSQTLILADLCQWIRDDLPLRSRLFARLVGVRQRLAMPLHLQLAVRDKPAARASRERMLAWPFQRVIMAHDTIVESGAHRAVADALAWLDP